MAEKVNRTKAILARHDIDMARLCSTDPEIQDPEIEKFILYLKGTGMTNEEIEQYLTNVKMELLNIIEENSNS